MSSAVEASLIDQEHGPVACAPSGFLTRCSIYLTLPTFPENSGVQLRWAHRQECLCSWTNALRSKHGFLLHLRTSGIWRMKQSFGQKRRSPNRVWEPGRKT